VGRHKLKKIIEEERMDYREAMVKRLEEMAVKNDNRQKPGPDEELRQAIFHYRLIESMKFWSLIVILLAVMIFVACRML